MGDFQQVPGFSFVEELGKGSFGVVHKCLDVETNETVAIKYIPRGPKIDVNVTREIANHRQLRHIYVVQFIKVALTDTHVAIIMEYATGGDLCQRICDADGFCEDEARYFFQQLLSGVAFCHSKGICHRDVKADNLLIDESPPAPRVKICDFGYSKSELLHSVPNTAVGTQSYVAPEVHGSPAYDGKIADVWSCGVTLYVMLFGSYPFEDPANPNHRGLQVMNMLRPDYIQNVLSRNPPVPISDGCKDLLARIFVLQPKKRITVPEIFEHDWFQRNLPIDLYNSIGVEISHPIEQSDEEIDAILEQGKWTLATQTAMTMAMPHLEESENYNLGSFGSFQDFGFGFARSLSSY